MKSENENSVRPIIIIISSIMMNKNYREPYKGQIPADTALFQTMAAEIVVFSKKITSTCVLLDFNCHLIHVQKS